MIIKQGQDTFIFNSEDTMEYDKLDPNKRLALVNARILNEESTYFQSAVNVGIAEAQDDTAGKAQAQGQADRSEQALNVLRKSRDELLAAGAVEGVEQAGPAGGPPGRRQ